MSYRSRCASPDRAEADDRLTMHQIAIAGGRLTALATLSALTALAVLPQQAQAREPAAADRVAAMPATDGHAPSAAVSALLPGARLVGQGVLRYWGFSVYYARLYAPPGWRASDLGQRPLVLELEYLRAFRGADIARRSIEEMRRAGPIDAALEAQWLSRLSSLFPDVGSGERLAGLWLPGQGARFQWSRADGSRLVLGGFDDPQLAERFFGIWLAPTTSAPALRAALLSGAGGPSS